MSEILRYVLVDRTGQEIDGEFDTFAQAIKCATLVPTRGHFAVRERRYRIIDVETVWTPDGGDVWPPAL